MESPRVDLNFFCLELTVKTHDAALGLKISFFKFHSSLPPAIEMYIFETKAI